MDVRKFRLDWRNSPQKQLDAMLQMLNHLGTMANQLADISVKLDVLPAIRDKIDTGNLLLQAIDDNTTCACNALQDVNEKLSEIVELLENWAPVPAPVYDFQLESVSHVLTSDDITSGYFDVYGVSLKDGVLFDSVTVFDGPDFLDPVVSVLPDNVFRLSFVPGVAVPNENFTIVLSQSESNVEQQFVLFHRDYVELGGVKWSVGCLIADPADSTGMTSIFAPRMDMYTDFYQPNLRKAWPSSGEIGDWVPVPAGDYSHPWLPEDDPSPDGWRLPTKAEFSSLVATGYIFREAGEAGNEVPGYFFGPNSAYASMSELMGCLFLSLNGYLRESDGVLLNRDVYAYYYGSSKRGGNVPGALHFSSSYVNPDDITTFGNPILCVKGSKPDYARYSLSYNSASGTLSGGTPAGNYPVAKVITLPTSAVRSGFIFDGFLNTDDWSGKKALGATFSMPQANRVVTATWKSAAPVITIEANVLNKNNIAVMILPVGVTPDWVNGWFYDLPSSAVQNVDRDGNLNVLVVGNAYTIHYIADSDPEVEKEIASLAAGGYYRLITS